MSSKRRCISDYVRRDLVDKEEAFEFIFSIDAVGGYVTCFGISFGGFCGE